jgi:hypothetical protein
MGKEGKSQEWELAYFGFRALVIGTLLGGIIGFGSSWCIWHLQQNVLEEQKLLERHNIANALYVDISDIERKYNSSLYLFSLHINNNTSILNNPNFVYWRAGQDYGSNWIYNVFGRDISGFDEVTSAMLYDFYKNAAEIDDYSHFIYQAAAANERRENITQFDIALAHIYTKALYEYKTHMIH